MSTADDTGKPALVRIAEHLQRHWHIGRPKDKLDVLQLEAIKRLQQE